MRGVGVAVLGLLVACEATTPAHPREGILNQAPTTLRNRNDVDNLAGRYLYLDGILLEAPPPHKGTHAVLGLETRLEIWTPNIGTFMAGAPWADYYGRLVRVGGILRATSKDIPGYAGPVIEIHEFGVIP